MFSTKTKQNSIFTKYIHKIYSQNVFLAYFSWRASRKTNSHVTDNKFHSLRRNPCLHSKCFRWNLVTLPALVFTSERLVDKSTPPPPPPQAFTENHAPHQLLSDGQATRLSRIVSVIWTKFDRSTQNVAVAAKASLSQGFLDKSWLAAIHFDRIWTLLTDRTLFFWGGGGGRGGRAWPTETWMSTKFGHISVLRSLRAHSRLASPPSISSLTV